MVEILTPQINFQREFQKRQRFQSSLEFLTELDNCVVGRNFGSTNGLVPPNEELKMLNNLGQERVQRKQAFVPNGNIRTLPLSQSNSPIYFDTKWSDGSNSPRRSPGKNVKLEFISGISKRNCNHQRVKSENFDQLMKEDLDELQNKIFLQAQNSDKHRHSINAIFDTFNQKRWIHKRIGTDDQPFFSPEKSEESSMNSSSLDLESSIEIKDEDRNAWIKSARDCDSDAILRLLTRDSHLVNCSDHIFGFTALHWAAKKGREDLIAMLVTSGASIDIRSLSGSTALHLATQSCKWNVVEMLIGELRADTKIRDNNSRRAIDYLKNGPPKIRSLLISGTYSTNQTEDTTSEEHIEIVIKEKSFKNQIKKYSKTIRKMNKPGSSEA